MPKIAIPSYKLLTVNQVSELTGLKLIQIYRLVKRNELNAIRSGSRIFIPEISLVKFIQKAERCECEKEVQNV